MNRKLSLSKSTAPQLGNGGLLRDTPAEVQTMMAN